MTVRKTFALVRHLLSGYQTTHSNRKPKVRGMVVKAYGLRLGSSRKEPFMCFFFICITDGRLGTSMSGVSQARVLGKD